MSNAPCGIPGSVRLSAAAVMATETNAVVGSSTPYSRARNKMPIIHVIGVATLKVETDRGSTNPETAVGSPSARALSTSAGSDASDELELSATAWGGTAARVNHPNG